MTRGSQLSFHVYIRHRLDDACCKFGILAWRGRFTSFVNGRRAFRLVVTRALVSTCPHALAFATITIRDPASTATTRIAIAPA
jgi:hypothetical protein